MGKNQSWKVTATPAQRWVLALITFADPDQMDREKRARGERVEPRKDKRKFERALARFRRALGLREPGDAFMRYNHERKQGEPLKVGPGARDFETRQVFTVTEADAEFYADFRERIDMATGDAFRIEDLIEQLEAGEDDARAETSLPYDEAADVERWRPLADEEAPARAHIHRRPAEGMT